MFSSTVVVLLTVGCAVVSALNPSGITIIGVKGRVRGNQWGFQAEAGKPKGADN
jgi:hypothetical protein